jgi:hypothetical protein
MNQIGRDPWRSLSSTRINDYEKRDLSHWRRLCRDYDFLPAANGANHVQDAEFTFAFPTCSSIPSRFAQQAEYPSNPVSQNDLVGRSK